MYSSFYAYDMATIFPVLLFLTWLPCILSQTEDFDSSTDPTMVECGPLLLPLAPCAPFVQGSLPSPAQPCCDNLIDLYDQQPNCLCILLNDTTMSSFPINKTLALQLPVLCHLEVNISSCPGLLLPPSSPSFAAAASPTIALAPNMTPRSNMMGLGFGRSASAKLKASLVLATTGLKTSSGACGNYRVEDELEDELSFSILSFFQLCSNLRFR
ncbi:hypothetical protein HHK36_024301 [Tetracentron sinense]|uniref:Bifunctional inhibitor/plant lipid transfer protein/seed storage helical domain-containing protein n=1 Tax=Tetracentron sinense TaxID=13715 RepID=A0A834YPH4_TETSI|nr:hypothetical protein HHK36_024301 [Tetracentron sinense]